MEMPPPGNGLPLWCCVIALLPFWQLLGNRKTCSNSVPPLSQMSGGRLGALRCLWRCAFLLLILGIDVTSRPRFKSNIILIGGFRSWKIFLRGRAFQRRPLLFWRGDVVFWTRAGGGGRHGARGRPQDLFTQLAHRQASFYAQPGSSGLLFFVFFSPCAGCILRV